MRFKRLIFYKNKIEINFIFIYMKYIMNKIGFLKFMLDGIVVFEWKFLFYENYNYFDFCL